ncbi:RagB/SusD family nutrient uptake outer membrane protein [Elizabethkingia meningoseptica]|uniref:RagB/SusD family nutrient uptake outer membrane protein n=1 Tax=Elizabethkingia meningoseptica TaxID=238 RepID=UPI0018C2140E|nr:RagB/SusD family nutrient uptake outer membrane protein [Elizabethkingia meningoseptica]MBG0513746.1 RagB/SusD family nutrient uptake outer membrane protein [Elizabethkingia meningoseptica]
MKLNKYIFTGVSVILAGISLVSCESDFLQKDPTTDITKENFFNNPQDLETYSNGFYSYIGAPYTDVFSDNISVYTGADNTDNLIRGSVTPANIGGWDWKQLRSINYMLENSGKATGDQSLIKHYKGVAKFFRANFYFNMVKKYGDVPWYSKTLDSNDEAMLYKAKDPRALVVDSIMSDLEYASANVLPARTNNTMITKWAALTLLARVALNEGTYRKYHEELALQNSASKFLNRAATASQEIMSNGGFSIYNTGKGAEDFRALFASNNLSANKEIIFFCKNNKDQGVSNNSHTVLGWQWALSRSLADEFLMKDGTPFTSVPNYDKKTFTEVFENRDPRMAETIMPPGFATVPGSDPYLVQPAFGGYLQVKFYPRDPSLRGGWGLNYTDLPIYRYAEVLLINAEAKAELGTLTQGDLDNTVNLLRRRVKMPDLSLMAANATVDNYLAKQYTNISGGNKGVILEIRRERRVELACEEKRLDDLFRWKAGALLGQASSGFYVSGLGAIDVTGDGKADIAILEAPGKEEPLSNVPADIKAKLTKFYISDGVFYLSNGNSGYIMFEKDRKLPRSFMDKYYYLPIPANQLILNPKLKQSPGW